jgi:hypothetical protein
MTIDKELLFKSRLPEADVEVADIGTVRVRGLSRAEVLSVQQTQGAAAAIERKMLALALLDPKLTEKEVQKWQEASDAGEIEPVTNKVVELSGMDPEAAKQKYKEMASNSDVEFRALPGSEAVDDGESPTD